MPEERFCIHKKGGSGMKRYFCFIAALIITTCILYGCAATKDLTSSITSKVGAITSNVDEQLFSQVPEEGRQGIPEAESDLKISQETLKLAEMKEKLAGAQKDYSGYLADLADKDYEAAALTLDIAKYEAIDRAGLGDKDKNVKNIAKLKIKKNGLEGDKINIEAKISIVERTIKNLTEQIKQQEEVVAGLTSPKGEAGEQVSSPPPAGEGEKPADTGAVQEGPAEKVTEPAEPEQPQPTGDAAAGAGDTGTGKQ
jgi:peptidoglycan hydrolase CwlO-like protein